MTRKRRKNPNDWKPRYDLEGSRTPWGVTQEAKEIAPGIVFHSTAGHGGIKLSADRNKSVSSAWRIRGGWYEEDVNAAIVVLTFPQYFSAVNLEVAQGTARRYLMYEG